MCNMCIRDIPPMEEAAAAAAAVPDRLKSLKMKHNLHTNPEDEVKQKEIEYQPDLLAFSTQRLRVVYDACKRRFAKFQDTKTYVMLTRTWQPLHVALAVAIVAVWLAGGSGSVRPWRALYVVALAIHLGAQVWMTLVSGIVLYFSLPRHEFGRVQTVLFPAYYIFNAAVSFVALLSYLKLHSITRFHHISWIQVALLLTVFTIEAFIRLKLVRPMLRTKHIKTQMEEAAGAGQEVGKMVLGELAHCPRYMKVLKAFRSYHSTVAAGTMISMGCSVYSIMILIDSMCGI